MKLQWTKSRFVSILILTGWEIGEGFTEKLCKEVKQNKSIPRSFFEPQLFWSLLYKGTVDMRLILLCSLYEIYSWPQKSREMLYSKHELDKLCTLVKIQDSESHTLVDGTYMLRSPESVHLYPLPFPTPSVHEQTLKLRMVKTKCIWPHTLITTKAYLHRHTFNI